MEDTDLFLVNRNDTTYKQTADELMAQLEDTDYLIVNRDDKTYKISGADFKDSVEPDTGSVVTGATVVASSEYPPSTLTATQPVVINATQDLSYDNWYKDGVAITGTTEQLVYNATSSGTYKYEERWVDNAGNELKPNATVTIKQSEVAKPTVLAPADGAGQGVDVTYYPETSAIATVGSSSGGWNATSADNAPTYRGVIASDTRIVAVADSTGAFSYSSDGVTWATTTSGVPSDKFWRSVAVNSSGKFVAVASTLSGQGSGSETGPKNIISTDGINWNTPSNPLSPSSSYSRVIWSDNHGVFIVGLESNAAANIAYSSTGDGWTYPDTISGDQEWTGIAVAPDSKIVFVAKGSASTSYPLGMYTYNLAQFFPMDDLPRETWQDVCWGDDKFVAVAKSGEIYYSSNGVNGWTKVEYLPYTPWMSITYADGKFVAVAQPGYEYNYGYSEDGINWTLDKIPGDTQFTDITYGLGQFVAVGNVGDDKIYTSTTGLPQTQTLTLTDDKAYNSSDDSEVTTIDLAFTEGTVVKGEGGTATNTEAFSTTLYNGGNGSYVNIDPNVDLTKKGLLWIKNRQVGPEHTLVSSEIENYLWWLSSNTLAAANILNSASGPTITVKSKNDIEINYDTDKVNWSTDPYVAWSFRAAPGFFDVVNYKGTGDINQRIPHGLGTKPGFIITKAVSDTSSWFCYHWSMNYDWTGSNELNDTGAGRQTGAILLNDAAGFSDGWGLFTFMEDDAFGVRYTNSDINSNGTDYIAYVFAGDTPNTIKCGRYTGNDAQQSIDCGFKPGWVLIKSITGATTYNWCIFDNKRETEALYPNSAAGDSNTLNFVGFSASGFVVQYNDPFTNSSSNEYIYIAIAEDAMAGEFPPTGVLAADADKSGPSMTLKDVTGTWEDGMTAVGQTELTQGAPDPTDLEFVGSIPAVANGTINTWGNATWTVTDTSDSSTQTETKAITAGQQQKLSVGNDITLEGGTTYNVTVKYDATDAVGATSDANTFKTDDTGIAANGNFSVVTYNSTGTSELKVPTGIDNTDGKSLVWVKSLGDSFDHCWASTEYTGRIRSNSSIASEASGLQSFDADGFTLKGDQSQENNSSSSTYVGYNFKASEGFFDIVTYNGTGGGNKTVPHNLGQTPGMMIIKSTTENNGWYIWHKSLSIGYYARLDSSNEIQYNNTYFPVEPTATEFTVGDTSAVNGSPSYEYVAFLFADNPDGGIKCGSYTGTDNPNEIDCGFQASWVLIKNIGNTAGVDWVVFDVKRGLTLVDDPNSMGDIWSIEPNTADWSGSGVNKARLRASSSGFIIGPESSAAVNSTGQNYMYVAIKDSINTDLFYNINTREIMRGFEIIAKHGIEPDSDAAKQLGFAELTEQPDYPVSGYELQADGRYKPIRSYEGLVAKLTAELAEAQATIDTYENP